MLQEAGAWQAVPSAKGTCPQVPSLGSQTPTVHPVEWAMQSICEPLQTPKAQASPTVQRFPSSQDAPSLAGTVMHSPV